MIRYIVSYRLYNNMICIMIQWNPSGATMGNVRLLWSLQRGSKNVTTWQSCEVKLNIYNQAFTYAFQPAAYFNVFCNRLCLLLPNVQILLLYLFVTKYLSNWKSTDLNHPIMEYTIPETSKGNSLLKKRRPTSRLSFNTEFPTAV